MRKIFLLCTLALSVTFGMLSASAFDSAKAGYYPLMIKTADKEVIVQVRLALTFDQRQKGLMYVKSMPANEGMLFIYPRAGEHSFWMRNTYIPLDIIFIKKDGTIANIHENVPILNDIGRASKGKVLSTLELNGGQAKKFGIKVGDKVIVPLKWRLKAEH